MKDTFKKILPIFIGILLFVTPAFAERDKGWRIGYRLDGDINHDCVVNDVDFYTAISLFTSKRGDGNYRGWIDTNKDGIIDMWDIGWIGLYYGSVC